MPRGPSGHYQREIRPASSLAAMTLRLAVVALVLAIGALGTIVALNHREADTVFLSQERNLPRLQSAAVEARVRTAPIFNAKPGSAARCRPQGTGQLRNPWQCRIVGHGPHRGYDFRVTVGPNGYYFGRRTDGGSGYIRGCCINVVALG